MSASKKITLVDVYIETDDEQYYTGKKVPVESGTGFVSLTGLVKIVCKNDQNGVNSTRFWKRLEETIDTNDWKNISKQVFISPDAVSLLVEQNLSSCKKSWAVFHRDGLVQFKRALRACKAEKYSAPSQKRAAISSPEMVSEFLAKKPRGVHISETNPLRFDHRDKALVYREKTLNSREFQLNEREKLINAREMVLHDREIVATNREKRLADKEKELEKKQGDEDMSVFFEQISSLTSKFKAKRMSSRRASPDSNERSPSKTPPDLTKVNDDTSEKTDESKELPVIVASSQKQHRGKEKQNNSPTPSKSPSPVPSKSPVRSI